MELQQRIEEAVKSLPIISITILAFFFGLSLTVLADEGIAPAGSPSIQETAGQDTSGEKLPEENPPAESAKPEAAEKSVLGSVPVDPAVLAGGTVAKLPKLPHASMQEFVKYMKNERKEDEKFLELRYKRGNSLIRNKDLYREKEIRAFLMTPREKFCRKWNLKRAYDHAFLDIGHGVTISGPHLVGRMTSAIDVQPTDRVLEIGTGSGYQSAVLSYLTDQVFTIEIIEALAGDTDKLYTELAGSGYPEYAKIKRKADDGYYGWEEFAPFDKIIVTCGIDHIPPPLLKQLKIGGIMVIPVGPPGAQILLKVTKNKDEEGNFVIAREDIYHGRKKVPFVPFTTKEGGTHFK